MKRARERTGLHQAQIGAILGVHQRTVANYEGGNTEPKIEILRHWAQITNVPVDWLILGITPEGQCPRCGDQTTTQHSHRDQRGADTRSRCFSENTEVSVSALSTLEGNVFYPSFDAPRKTSSEQGFSTTPADVVPFPQPSI